MKRTLGLLFGHRKRVGGEFSTLLIVKFDSKREHKRSAFSFAELASDPSGLCTSSREDLQKLSSTALARDQKAPLPEGRLTNLSPILRMCRVLALVIYFLLNLVAELNYFLIREWMVIRASCATQVQYACRLRFKTQCKKHQTRVAFDPLFGQRYWE